MADPIVVMHDGIVEQIGTPLELYDNPANLFVAGFIGSPAMNFLSARAANGSVELPGGMKIPAPNGAGDVKVGIRPEHLTLAAGGPGLPATVKVVEPTGAETLVLFDVAGHDTTAVFSERHAFRPGEKLSLAPKSGMLHVFDAASGKRL
jgi:multiple sugar transport system ATP-binding protein